VRNRDEMQKGKKPGYSTASQGVNARAEAADAKENGYWGYSESGVQVGCLVKRAL